MSLSKIRQAAVQSIAVALALSLPSASYAQIATLPPTGGAPQVPGAPIWAGAEAHRVLVERLDSLQGSPEESLPQLETLWDEFASAKEETPSSLAAHAVLYSLLSGEGREPVYKKLLASGLPEPTAARLAGLSNRWAEARRTHAELDEALSNYGAMFREVGAPEPPKLDTKKAPSASGSVLATVAGARFAWPEPVSKLVGELDALEMKDPAAAVRRADAILSDKGESRLEVRVHAVRTLGKLVEGRDKLIEHAAAFSAGSTESYYVKREAAKLLAANAASIPSDKKAGPIETLKKMYQDANASVRLMAGDALRKFGVEPGPDLELTEASPKRTVPNPFRPTPRSTTPTNPGGKGVFKAFLAVGILMVSMMILTSNVKGPPQGTPAEPPAISQTADPAPASSVSEDPQAQAARELTQQVKQLKESNQRLEQDVRGAIEQQKKDAEAAASSRMWSLLLQLAIPILFLFLIMKSMSKGAGGVMSDASKIKYSLEKPDTTFNDVAGVDEAKTEIAEVVDFLRDPARYKRQGARVPKGVILYGPPGTGKTLLAKAVANATNANFIAIKGSDFVEMFVGVGASRARALFEYARQHGPCIIFIDEFDAVAKERGAKGVVGGHDERDQTINAMLAEMDGFDNSSGVVVIAATNRLDVLDEAVTRPGRFDRKIEVTKPSVLGREAILAVHGKNKRLAPDVDLKFIANRTAGHSGADLENVTNEAAILTVRAGKDAATMEELNEAVDKGRMGQRKDSYLSPEVKKRLAVHEIGHVAANIAAGEKVNKVTIIGRGNVGGFAETGHDEDKFLYTENELRARISVLLGSAAAEKSKLGQFSTGAEDDIQRANQIARTMVKLGMSEDSEIGFYRPVKSDDALGQYDASPEMAARIDRAVHKILDQGWKDAQKAVEACGAGFDALVEALVEKETLTRDQIEAILAPRAGPVN